VFILNSNLVKNWFASISTSIGTWTWLWLNLLNCPNANTDAEGGAKELQPPGNYIYYVFIYIINSSCLHKSTNLKC